MVVEEESPADHFIRIMSDQLSSRYVFLKLLSYGEICSTWLGHPIGRENERVVIKVFTSTIARNEAATLMEAFPVAMKTGLVQQLVEFDLDEDRPYIVTEFCEGETLAALLEKGQAFDYRTVAWMIHKLIGAIKALADCETSHSDIKPSNIIVDLEARRLCLIDFGEARYLAMGTRSKSSDVRGTLAYMAPQVLAAVSTRDEYFIVAADLWSTGVILYQLLTGQRPYPAARGNIGGTIDAQKEIQIPASLDDCPLMKRLVSGLLTYDERGRMSLDEAVECTTQLLEMFV